MAAATHQDAPTSPTKLQKMLDLEHKLKMERLHGSPGCSRLSLQTGGHDTMPPHESLPARSAHRSSPNVANLTILIPPSTTTISSAEKPREPAQSPLRPQSPSQHPQETDNLAGKGDDEKSDAASSICQSPSWEGYGQRKKEKKAETKKRRKNKEQADGTTQQASKITKKSAPTAKLTKPPPASASRQINNPPNADRDPESRRSRRSSTQPDHYPPSASRPHHKRRRSSSVASQIRAVFTGQKTKEKKEEKEKEKPNEVGFIGGLKLEKEREAARKAAEAAVQGPDKPHLDSPDDRPSSLPLTSQSTTPDAVATPQTAPLNRDTPPSSNIVLPRTHASSSPISLAAQERPPATGAQGGHIENSPSSTDGAYRGRQGGSYVQQQRQQSQDRALVGFRDETLISSRSHYPPPARRPQYARSYSPNSEASGQATTDATPAPSMDTMAESSQLSLNVHDSGFNDGQSSASQGSTTHSARSPPTGPVATKSFRNSMQAALYRFKPTPGKPLPSHDNPEVERQSSSTISTPNMTASASSDGDRDEPSSELPPPAGRKADMPRMVKAQDAAGPSSSSSSCDDSLRDSSIITTPDSFRPQSDDKLPSVPGDLRKGPLGAQSRTDWNTKVVRTAQPITGPTSGPISPRNILVPTKPRNDGDVLPDGGHGKAETVAQRSRKPLVVNRGKEPASESHRAYLLPMEVSRSKADLVPAPLEATPVSNPNESSRVARDSGTTLSKELKPKPKDGRSTTLQRILSLPKSRSTTSVEVGSNSSPRETKGTPVPAPPPRARARRTSGPPIHTSSASLPDPPPPISAPAPTDSPRSPDTSSPTAEVAPGDVPPSAPIPLGASRLTSSRKDGAADPLAKILVECCHCRFFHDMPSRVYECMVRPQAEVADPALGVSGAITTMVNCPWCKHGMTTQCCAGYAAVVYLKERLH